VPIALEAATELIVEEETFCEVIALGRLLPLDLAPVLESVARSGALVTAEEGALTGGVGAEIAARVQEEAWGDLRRPIRRVAAADGIIPAAPGLENARLPAARQIVESVLSLVGSRTG
jgi:pyruvate dehydrogenase E1 component beta subunit